MIHPLLTFLQWGPDAFASFVNTSHPDYDATTYSPWLPVLESAISAGTNVEEESGDPESNLGLFKRLMEMRRESVFLEGEVFYPYHDEQIFSFMR